MGGNCGGYSPNVIRSGRNMDKLRFFFMFIHKNQTLEILYPTVAKRKDAQLESIHKA